jgi:hypothetical protein
MEIQLKYPQWQQPLQDAILAIQQPQYLEKLDNAKNAILERLLVLATTNSDQDERQALADALKTIQVLKQP